MTNIHEAIRATHEGVIAIIGSTQDEIVAKDKNQNFIVIDWAAVVAWVDPTAYQRKRAAEYPPMADYLDGVVKGDQAQIDAYVAACLAVKAKYPKEQA